jgi:hypothetical protein
MKRFNQNLALELCMTLYLTAACGGELGGPPQPQLAQVAQATYGDGDKVGLVTAGTGSYSLDINAEALNRGAQPLGKAPSSLCERLAAIDPATDLEGLLQAQLLSKTELYDRELQTFTITGTGTDRLTLRTSSEGGGFQAVTDSGHALWQVPPSALAQEARLHLRLRGVQELWVDGSLTGAGLRDLIIEGDDKDNTLYFTGAPSSCLYVSGGEGADVIDASGLALPGDGGSLTVMATISGGDGNDTLYGTPYADTIYGYAGNDTIYGQDGDDTVRGGKGNDFLYGGKGSDSLNGDEDDDHIEGQEGNDHCEGNSGNNDRVYGGPGDDRVHGGGGVGDVCYGGTNATSAGDTCRTTASDCDAVAECESYT